MDAIAIGIIGDYDTERPSHIATVGALKHCAASLGINLEPRWLPTESLEEGEELQGFDGFWCAPGSPYRSMRGALNAIRFARENNRPFLGTCGGFQHAVLEYAQNVLGAEAKHREYDPDATDPVITALSCSLIGEKKSVLIARDSQVYGYYGKTEAEESFNCNYGLNPGFRRSLDESGFGIAGTDENGEVRILELRANRFHIATLFQPQLNSLPENPHVLILAFLIAAKEFHSSK